MQNANSARRQALAIGDTTSALVASLCSIKGQVMKRSNAIAVLVALLMSSAGFAGPLRAETGDAAVVFTKGGFVLGVGGGEGVLLLQGKRYPFTVSGMSLGFTIGASTTRLVGRALNLRGLARLKAVTAQSEPAVPL